MTPSEKIDDRIHYLSMLQTSHARFDALIWTLLESPKLFDGCIKKMDMESSAQLMRWCRDGK